MNYKKRYDDWVNNEFFDQSTRDELRAIVEDEREIEDRFYRDLEFGTAGLRGVIGAGSNRMNKYTVAKATQGFANYILKTNPENKIKGVAIAYDSRNQSPEFAEQAALVLNANGIKTFIFSELKPVPVLSFAIRELGTAAGIVITASHNPPEYNGYKVYWSDGSQVPFPRDAEIMDEVNAVESFSDVKVMSVKDAREAGLFNVIEEDIDDKYINTIKKFTQNKDVIEKAKDDLKIVYTPLHGSGNKPVKRVLHELGYKHVYVVPEQEEPDPAFPTIDYPNPEDPKTFQMAIALAKDKNADIVLATDPDADRVGVAVRNNNGEFVLLTGNMTGTILMEYILRQRSEKGTLPNNAVVIKTIVTTEMITPIAQQYGVKVLDVLTGFKYIGEKIKKFEETNEYTYVFGFEESYGSLPGTYARDKDAVAATMLLCEIAASLKLEGKTLYDGLIDLYLKYGYYKENVKSITLKGKDGNEKIAKIMTTLRDKVPVAFSEIEVTHIEDYLTSEKLNIITKQTSKIALPKSNVLRYTLKEGSWICVRPSGTEPKIKLYLGIKAENEKDANEKSNSLLDSIVNLVESI